MMRRASIVVSVVLLAAACGSTVDVSSGAAGGSTGRGRATVEPSAHGASAVPGPGRAAAPETGPQASTLTGQRRQAPRPEQEAAEAPSGLPRAAVPHATRTEGVTDDAIVLGLTYVVSGNEYAQAVGGGAATSTDQRRALELLVADLNDRGGIHGRRIEPVFHEYDALTSDDRATVAQQTCSQYTEDNHVFAAISIGSEALIQCMQDAGAPLIYTAFSPSSARVFEAFPLYFEPGNINLTRGATATVDSLAARDFFPSDARIGIVAYDEPNGRETVEGSIVPALARHGLAPTRVAYVPLPENQGDITGMSAAISSTVLRFNTEGIGHVMIADYNALMTFLFMQEAESQRYRPRYGLNSQNGNTALSDLLASSGSQGQLIDSLSVGWVPVIDLRGVDDPNDRAPAPRQRCLQVLHDGGLTSFDSRNAIAQALAICEQLWFFADAANAAGRDLSTGSFVAGVEALGTSHATPFTLATRFGPGRHDGVAKVADMAFLEECRCFRYTAAPYEVE